MRRTSSFATAAGPAVDANGTKATSRAEREAVLAAIELHDPDSERRLTLGAGKGYDTQEFVALCWRMCVTPHAAEKMKHSAIGGRTARPVWQSTVSACSRA